jgi:hypothetical protein
LRIVVKGLTPMCDAAVNAVRKLPHRRDDLGWEDAAETGLLGGIDQ